MRPGSHRDREVLSGCRPLIAEAATVSAARQALDGAPPAHLAAHGHHDQENFLFFRLDLADGPLMAYDIQQLVTAPRQVVSVILRCPGRTVVRPGEEILGFTAALLYVGTATADSSVTRVADTRRCSVGADLAFGPALAQDVADGLVAGTWHRCSVRTSARRKVTGARRKMCSRT